jgi:hypothetical protein
MDIITTDRITKDEGIKRVHVIYKTHLDVGFTDYAENVINHYVEHFIPQAIALAKEVNTPQKKKFVWSVGAWIVDYYLRNTTGNKRQMMVEAIQNDDISWHGMPFTPHIELMSKELFLFGLTIAKNLNKTFGKQTVAAKMTDVPGHTKAIIPYLNDAGIKYLHVGINGASAMPEVPETFRWQDDFGNELLVEYCRGYGNEKVDKYSQEVLYFSHSADNFGPPTRQEVEQLFAELEEKYPGAEIFGSNLNLYAEKALENSSQYPVIQEEIGDSWIHGVASDPQKVGLFKEYLRFIEEDRNLSPAEKEDFYREILLVPEHTWGLDFKKYLADYKNWDKESFRQAKEFNYLDPDYAADYPSCYEFARKEFEHNRLIQVGESGKYPHIESWEERTYSLFELSHQEQREYLERAMQTLEPATRKTLTEVKQNFLTMELVDEITEARQKCSTEELSNDVVKTEHEGLITEPTQDLGNGKFRQVVAEEPFIIWGQETVVHEDGSISRDNQRLGRFSYVTFGTEHFERYQEEYSYDLEGNYDWAMPDFYKCGFEKCGAEAMNNVYYPALQHAYVDQTNLLIQLSYDEELCKGTGCPREILIKYIFMEKEISVELQILKKDATRMPEALWFSFFEGNNFIKVWLKKLDILIDPYRVVSRGNRGNHAVEAVVLDDVTLEPLHSPLVSIGEKSLYDFNQEYAPLAGGVHFNIYNNLWNTNFKMWYDDDIKSNFNILFL